MTITIQVSGLLRDYCGCPTRFELDAATVRGALVEIERAQPALHKSVCDEAGAVRRHVNIFVNTHNIRDGQRLDTALTPGDVVTILQAVSGG